MPFNKDDLADLFFATSLAIAVGVLLMWLLALLFAK